MIVEELLSKMSNGQTIIFTPINTRTGEFHIEIRDSLGDIEETRIRIDDFYHPKYQSLDQFSNKISNMINQLINKSEQFNKEVNE